MKKLNLLIPIIVGAVLILPFNANASGWLDKRLDNIEHSIKKIFRRLRNQPKVPVLIDANGKQVGEFLAVDGNDYDYLAVTNGKEVAWLELQENGTFSSNWPLIIFDGPNCTGTAYTNQPPEMQRPAAFFQGTIYAAPSLENATLVQDLVVQSKIQPGNDNLAICVNEVGLPNDYYITDTSFPTLVFTPPLRIELR